MDTNEQLIHDTGRFPIWMRLPIALAGLTILWLSASFLARHFTGFDLWPHFAEVRGSTLLEFFLGFGFGLFFVSIWFLRDRYTYDLDRREVVIDHWGLLGRSRKRITIANASAVYLRRWSREIGLECHGRLVRVIGTHIQAEAIVRVLSDHTNLPIVRKKIG